MTRRLLNLLASLVHSLFPSPGGMIAVGVFGLLSTMFMTGHVPADAPRTWWIPAAAVLISSGLMIAFGVVRQRRAIARSLVEERRRRSKASGLCPSCGYDLRATLGRCPECGTILATTP